MTVADRVRLMYDFLRFVHADKRIEVLGLHANVQGESMTIHRIGTDLPKLAKAAEVSSATALLPTGSMSRRRTLLLSCA